jgi:di/tricarboxylate transporter
MMIVLQLKSDCVNSGFSTWLVQYLITLRGLPVWVINLIVSIIAATMTEVVSNTATANVLLPILLEMSLTLCQNPTYLGKFQIISSERNHFFQISR